jgi:hypothetical protein
MRRTMSEGKSAAYILAQNPPPSHLAKAAPFVQKDTRTSGTRRYI